MKNDSILFNRFLVMGYTFIILLVMLSASMFYRYEHNLSASLKNYTQLTEQKESINNIIQLASERIATLFKMFTEEDLFTLDALQQDMLKQEHDIGVNLTQLKQHPLTPEQQKQLKLILADIRANKKLQQHIYTLLFNQNGTLALKPLINQSLPLQKQAQTKLNHFKQQLTLQAHQAQKQYQALTSKMRWLILLATTPIILSLIIIAFLSVRKMHRYAKNQQQLLNTLENKVRQRTQALLMDKKLLTNIHEAIGVINQQGQLIVRNKQLDKLLQTCQCAHISIIWPCLQQAFQALDIKTLQTQIPTQDWQQEVISTQNPQTYFRLNIDKIDDNSLPETYYSLVLTNISELKSTQSKLEQIAHYDAVTDLRNRRSFNEIITNQIAQHPNNPFYLLYLDLEDFKWINDNLGHIEGDLLLKKTGQICTQVCQPEDTIARLGSDEFAIIIRQDLTEYELTKRLHQLINQFKIVNKNLNTDHNIGINIGVAHYPIDGKTPDTLLKHADYAMRQSQIEGSNCFKRFSNTMNKHMHYLHEIETQLRQAVKNNDFTVHYQPQHNLKTLEVIGAEALIRWQTPDRAIPPDEFIPLAERLKLINDIGEFVFTESIKQLKTWQTTPHILPRIAINVSSIQLLSGNFGTFVENTLHKHNLPAHQVDIEITETVMMENIDQAHSTNNCLNQLQQRGMEISIDDFGTGYSSLAYIKHLNVDRIKIDKSFVDDLEHSSEAKSIIEAIIKMGHSLDLTVLAEGIENATQLNILQTLGCDEGQGYYFSRPLTPENFEQKCL